MRMYSPRRLGGVDRLSPWPGGNSGALKPKPLPSGTGLSGSTCCAGRRRQHENEHDVGAPSPPKTPSQPEYPRLARPVKGVRCEAQPARRRRLRAACAAAGAATGPALRAALHAAPPARMHLQRRRAARQARVRECLRRSVARRLHRHAAAVRRRDPSTAAASLSNTGLGVRSRPRDAVAAACPAAGSRPACSPGRRRRRARAAVGDLAGSQSACAPR